MTNFNPHRYTITIKLVTLDEGDQFEAVVAELPDLVEYGETCEQAYALVADSIEELYKAAKEQGRDFPAPAASRAIEEYSGRITLRMAKSLHASASRLADMDSVSLNSWIVEAVAARVGADVSRAADSTQNFVETRTVTGDLFIQAMRALALSSVGSKTLIDAEIKPFVKTMPASRVSKTDMIFSGTTVWQ